MNNNRSNQRINNQPRQLSSNPVTTVAQNRQTNNASAVQRAMANVQNRQRQQSNNPNNQMNQPSNQVQSEEEQKSTELQQQILKDEEIAQQLQLEEEQQFARQLILQHHISQQQNRTSLRQIERRHINQASNQVRVREQRISSIEQVRRHHIRQQLSPEEQLEFDEHYGEEDDLMYEEQSDSQEEEEIDEEGQEQMEYYMQQHPELLLALDIAAFRRQQMQQRLEAAQEEVQETDRSRSPSANANDLTSEHNSDLLQNPQINLYGNLSIDQNDGLGTGYSYQAARENLLQQIQLSRPDDEEGPGDMEEAANDEFEEEDSKQDDEEEEEDEYDTQNEDDEDDDLEEEEADEVMDPEENELECYIRNVNIDNSRLRAKTAPLRPMEHVEQFKMTPNFTNLEQAAVCAVQIVQRNDSKFDLDSFEGQNSCKKFLGFIEKLCDSLEIKSQNRSYRKNFSNAYKVLYKEGKLCYLTEILDSAQEAFPYLYVNGEKYVFSKQVIETGKKLFKNFCQLLYDTKESYQRICEEQNYQNIVELVNEIRSILEEFDCNWVEYEKLYVIELMLIEQDARRYIQEAIDIEKEITSAEVRERAKGKIMVECTDYNKNRKKLVEVVNKINAVANPDGKGRDDLQVEILFQAEGICRRISSSQSKAVRKLAEGIRKSLQALRTLFRKYEENIEGVDPQLKNNADLVAALVDFESSWEKGKAYFVSAKKCQQLIHFTSVIEATSEKYSKFQEQVEDRDTVIFVSIPALLILKCLDNDDKGICKSFFPPMFGEDGKSSSRSSQNEEEEDNNPVDKEATSKKFLELKHDYNECKAKAKNEYDFFNLVERCILGMEDDETPDHQQISDEEFLANGMDRQEMHTITQHIRFLSMQMQRYRPQEWNEFLIVALDS